MTTTAKVKSILSGDTLLFDNGAQLSLAYVSAPRLQSEPYGFASREALRTLLVGKPLKYRVWYSINGRDYGDASAPVFASLIEHALEQGSVKLREGSKPEFPELGEKFSAAQDRAQSAKAGLWNDSTSLPEVLQIVTDDLLHKPLPAIVERVISGDRVQLRVLVNPSTHILSQCLLAGIRAPRSAGPTSDAEEFGNEAKLFTESRLLQRSVTATFFGTAANGLPVADLVHPNGNVALFLLEAGLASVSDWQSTLLGASKMQVLRSAEKKAKAAHARLWKNVSVAAGSSKQYPATVFKVVSPDTLELIKPDESHETVQLTSVRAPRKNDEAALSAYVPVAKEFARKLLVGKKVMVTVDGTRPESAIYDARPLVTISLDGVDVAESLIAAGYATAVRHRRDDTASRSPNWDKLMELEQQATAAHRGVHSLKPAPSYRAVDASDSHAKASTYLNSLSRSAHPLAGVVEHVAAAGRLRVYIQKMDIVLTLVLLGVRAAKPGEPAGDAALAHVQRLLTQRDIKFFVSGIDKTGAFIGLVYMDEVLLNVDLVEHGYASLHEPSLRSVHGAWVAQAQAAESEAKQAGKGIWHDYRAKQEQQQRAAAAAAQELERLAVSPNKMNYIDIIVTDVSATGELSFRKSKDDALFSKISADVAAAWKTAKPQPSRKGSLVMAMFDKVYRARVLSFDKASGVYSVLLIDTGRTATCKTVKPLSSTAAGLATQASLTFVRPPAGSPTDYLSEYVAELQQYVGTRVVANIDSPAGVEPVSATVYAASSRGAEDSVNAYLIEDGFAYVKTRLAGWELADAFREKRERMKELCDAAQRDRIGVWEYGYSAEDEE